MSSADRVAHIDGQLITNYCEQYTLAEYKCPKVIKPSNPFTNVCWSFCFNNIFCAATNFGYSTVFLLPNSRNEEMMGDGSFGATAAGLFWTVNVLERIPVISRASAVASSIFFMVLFPMLFEVRRIVCVEN